MFLHRDNELELLKNDFIKPISTFNIVFGRRKVGKTSLVNEYIKEKHSLYLFCTEMVPSLLYNQLAHVIQQFFGLKKSTTADSFEDVINLITQSDIEQKLIIIFDDFQNLQKYDKNIFSTFYSLWAKKLRLKNVQVIISSSLCSSHKDDLNIYKKASNEIYLKSLNFKIIKTLLPKLNKNDSMYVYSAFGTNPQYLTLYDEKKDFILNIKDNFLSYDSFIYNEGINIIKNDLSDVSTYFSILYAVAMGNKKIGDIAKFIDVKSSYLTRYLQKLVDIMVLSKHIPVNDNPLKSKFGRYEIEDNFLKFWFCYIYPNGSMLQRRDYYPIISHIRRDFSKRLVKDAYRRYVLELVENEPEKFLGYLPVQIGSWWNNKENEIDVVAYNNKDITFINCKWRQKESAKFNYEELKSQTLYFETTLNRKYAIFAKNLGT